MHRQKYRAQSFDSGKKLVVFAGRESATRSPNAGLFAGVATENINTELCRGKPLVVTGDDDDDDDSYGGKEVVREKEACKDEE